VPDCARDRFEAEILPHLDAAYRLALTLTRQKADAEDLVQESIVHAYRGFAGFRRGSNARAWLLTIVRHTCFNLARRARSRPREEPLTTTSDGRRGALEPVDTAPEPEQQAIATIERERLLDALAGVPEPFRSVVALVDLGELRYAEAAEVLGCPRGTIMSRLHRGRLLLAERLGLGMAPGEDGANERRRQRRAVSVGARPQAGASDRG